MLRVSTVAVGVLRHTVLAMAVLAGGGILFIMALTCVDVLLRAMGRSLTGTIDLVRMAGVVTLACAMPYTTAVKGHVAIEYFYHRLRRRGRLVVGVAVYLASSALFGLLAWQCLLYGAVLRRSGEVTPTLQWPAFWAPWVMAFSFFVVVLVLLYNMTHPRREFIKP